MVTRYKLYPPSSTQSGLHSSHYSQQWTGVCAPDLPLNWGGNKLERKKNNETAALIKLLVKAMSSWPTCRGDWLQSSSSFGGILDCQKIVLWPARARFPARNSLVNEVGFLGLNTKTSKDQWDCEISNYYYVATTVEFVHLHSSIRSFFERVVRKMFWTLLGYSVVKACTSPRNSTWFTRPFLLVRGWGLGTRLQWKVLFIWNSAGSIHWVNFTFETDKGRTNFVQKKKKNMGCSRKLYHIMGCFGWLHSCSTTDCQLPISSGPVVHKIP